MSQKKWSFLAIFWPKMAIFGPKLTFFVCKVNIFSVHRNMTGQGRYIVCDTLKNMVDTFLCQKMAKNDHFLLFLGVKNDHFHKNGIFVT